MKGDQSRLGDLQETPHRDRKNMWNSAQAVTQANLWTRGHGAVRKQRYPGTSCALSYGLMLEQKLYSVTTLLMSKQQKVAFRQNVLLLDLTSLKNKISSVVYSICELIWVNIMFADETGVKINRHFTRTPAICLNLEEHTIILYKFSVRNLWQSCGPKPLIHISTHQAPSYFFSHKHTISLLCFSNH